MGFTVVITPYGDDIGSLFQEPVDFIIIKELPFRERRAGSPADPVPVYVKLINIIGADPADSVAVQIIQNDFFAEQ